MTFDIKSIPTVLFIKNGELVDKMVGSAKKSKYEEKFINIKNKE